MTTFRVGNPISAALAYPLLAYHQRRINRSELATIPVWLWNGLPERMKKWIDDRVLRIGQDYAWQLVDAHEVLGPLENGERNPWALSPSSRLFLWKTVQERKPRRIIDFGSGKSTLLFASYASQMARQGVDVRICSVEHDPNWLAAIQMQLEQRRLEQFVTLLEAPLTTQHLIGREMVAYSVNEDALEKVAGGIGFDLCLVDGPPGHVGRAGALAVTANFLADGALILLDDAYRSGEQAIVREWRKAWPDRLSNSRIVMADRHGLATMSWSDQRGAVRRRTSQLPSAQTQATA